MTVKSSLEVQCESKGDVLLPKFDLKMELSNTAVDDNVTTMYPTVKLFLLVAVKRYTYTLFFFIRTSNFGAKAERSYILYRFEAENVLKMFLNYMVYTTCISVNQ